MRIDHFLLFFIHIDSRRVWASPATNHPTGEWMAQRARNFTRHLAERGQAITHLIRDRDNRFSDAFDEVLRVGG